MTTHDETKRKKRKEVTAEIEDGKKKIRQLENREKVLRQKLSQEERRTRSHRLIVKGAEFEKAFPLSRDLEQEHFQEVMNQMRNSSYEAMESVGDIW